MAHCEDSISPAFSWDKTELHLVNVNHRADELVIYDKSSPSDSVNEVRRELFTKQNRTLENIPPTQVSTQGRDVDLDYLFTSATRSPFI